MKAHPSKFGNVRRKLSCSFHRAVFCGRAARRTFLCIFSLGAGIDCWHRNRTFWISRRQLFSFTAVVRLFYHNRGWSLTSFINPEITRLFEFWFLGLATPATKIAAAVTTEHTTETAEEATASRKPTNDESPLEPRFESKSHNSVVITELFHQLQPHLAIFIVNTSLRWVRKYCIRMIYFFELLSLFRISFKIFVRMIF